MKIIWTPGVKSCISCIANHIFVSEACAPSRVKVSFVVLQHNIVKYNFTKVNIVSITSWKQNSVNFGKHLLNNALRLSIYDWYHSSSCGFHEFDIRRHNIIIIIIKLWILLHWVFKGLRQDTDHWLLVKIDILLPIKSIGVCLLLKEFLSAWCSDQ